MFHVERQFHDRIIGRQVLICRKQYNLISIFHELLVNALTQGDDKGAFEEMYEERSERFADR